MIRRVAGALVDLAAAVPPASGAVVMGTGIVSIGLALDGYETLSRILLGIAWTVWFVLAVVLLTLLLRHRALLLRLARMPVALTGVAGTDVLGSRLTLLGWNREAAVLLAGAVVLWLLLVPYVLAHWRRPAVGSFFLITVATESIAVLSARLAIEDGVSWLAFGAAVFLGLGLVFYVLVLAAFDFRQLLVGRGDHWVSGGALAIATLASARCAQAAASVGGLGGAREVLDTLALVLWAAALVWLPLLVAAEIVRPRVTYDVRRWSTVFPLGMYAVCTFADSQVQGIGAFSRVASGWIWLAAGVWLAVSAGLVRRLLRLRGRVPAPA